MIRWFDSVAALRTEAIERQCTKGYENRAMDEWCGETEAQTLARSAKGDLSLVPEAEALIERLSTGIETRRFETARVVVGSRYAVPDVILGRPRAMRRKRHVKTEHAPVTLLVVSTSSGATSADALRARGAAALALTMVLARNRPVHLFTVSILEGEDASGETVFATRIETAPLDLAIAAYALTSAGFDRRLNHGIAWRVNGCRGSWPSEYYKDANAYYESLRERLAVGAKADSLVIRSASLYEPIITDPVAWLNDTIAGFNAEEDEGEGEYTI